MVAPAPVAVTARRLAQTPFLPETSLFVGPSGLFSRPMQVRRTGMGAKRGTQMP